MASPRSCGLSGSVLACPPLFHPTQVDDLTHADNVPRIASRDET